MNKIITSNMYLGADNIGILEGISTLKNNGIFSETTDCLIQEVNQTTQNQNNLKYHTIIVDYLKKLYQLYLDSLKEGDKPILIGGDHSIAIASVVHSLERYKNLGVIWIDAHADINTEYTTSSGNIHGMSVASLLGKGDNELANFIERTNYLDPKNLVYIGLRDVEVEEKKLLNAKGIKYYTFLEVQKKGIQLVMDEIFNYLKKNNIEKVHVSYDLDSADPQLVPGVSTPVPGGFTLSETIFILEQLHNQFDIIAFDIVEFNPIQDEENKTLLFFEIIFSYVKKIISGE